jgi:hypothetical protein
VHYRATIPEMTARHVIVDLLASSLAHEVTTSKARTQVVFRRARWRGEVCGPLGRPRPATTRF